MTNPRDAPHPALRAVAYRDCVGLPVDCLRDMRMTHAASSLIEKSIHKTSDSKR